MMFEDHTEINTGKYTTETLMPQVYLALRDLAMHRINKLAPGTSLSGTELVHEVYLRLSKESDGPKWANQRQFFSAAAEAMRRVLIDRIRANTSAKRGGGQQRVELDSVGYEMAASAEKLLEINEALDVLAASDPEIADLVKMRFFVGMTQEQIAEATGVSVRTVARNWVYAKAWLADRLGHDS